MWRSLRFRGCVSGLRFPASRPSGLVRERSARPFHLICSVVTGIYLFYLIESPGTKPFASMY